ncbi:MAG TPA: SLC13 family permease [Anaerolineales bacterium]|nr:SLC13 family permease [Anaerolineales bacterium]
MKLKLCRALLLAFLAGAGFWLTVAFPVEAQEPDEGSNLLITGSIYDRQGASVNAASVELWSDTPEEPLTQAVTQPDGRFALHVSNPIPQRLTVRVVRAHFQTYDLDLDPQLVAGLQPGSAIALPDITLFRRIDLAFWLATLIFIAVLLLIAFNNLHNTLAALLGATVIFFLSYVGSAIYEGFYIFDFTGALRYVDWNVIFLIMGMMIVIAVVERTGIFQWLAFFAYRISRGRTWLLMIILMMITGIASAFLDNVTTMLLMTPISVQIALSLGINPLALLMPEVFASNVVGISTLVGTPTNILIGSYARISFNDFLVNLTPGVVVALVGLVIYCELAYRRELKSSAIEGISELLINKLEEQAVITELEHLKKAGWVGLGMLVLFIFGERIHLLPSVTALMGATALLVWIRPDIEEMIEAVDWTTLVFFISLFICVGAIQEVGLVSLIAEGIARLVGDSLVLAMLSILWMGAILSTVIANIPFTAAMLPVIAFLTKGIPGAESKVLFYCLSVGSAMGGNGSLIGASANMVTSGIAERAGYSITYVYFLKKGFPALLITVGLAMLWLLMRFLL